MNRRGAPSASPTFACRIAPAINHHVEQADEHTRRWATELGLVRRGDPRYGRFLAARFPWLAARAYPEVGVEDLALVSDWITFLFFFDDICDTRAAAERGYRDELVARQDRLIAIAHGAAARATDSPLDRAFIDIRDRVAARSGPFWQQRFADHVQAYIEGCRWEQLLRAEGRTPTLATYAKLRPLISAVPPCFDLAGIFLDGHRGEVARSLPVQQLEMMAINHICWVNDIHGLEKEIGEQTTSNLVLVLANEHGLSRDEAVERAVAMCDAELDAFFDLASHLVELGVCDGRGYVRALEAWMRGNLDWYSETRRYRREGRESAAA